MYKHMSSKALKHSASRRLAGNMTSSCIWSFIILILYIAITFIEYDFMSRSNYNIILTLFIKAMRKFYIFLLYTALPFHMMKLYCGISLSLRDILRNTQWMHFAKLALHLSFSTLFLEMPADILNALYNQTNNTWYLIAAFFCMGIFLIFETLFLLKMALYYHLMLDYPSHSPKQLQETSKRLMKGHKGRLFYIYVSLLPLVLLSICTFGIGFIWLIPYAAAIHTEFYLDIVTHL